MSKLVKATVVLGAGLAFIIIGYQVSHPAEVQPSAVLPYAVQQQTTTEEPSAPSPTQQAQAAAPPASQWSYSDTTDEMNGTSEHFAQVDSDNQLQFDFPYAGGSTGTLGVRRGKQYGNNAYVRVDKGQILCDVEGCSVRVKFDNQAPQQFSASEPSDGSSNYLFIKPYGKFVSELKSSHTVLLELEFFQEGRHVLRFNTDSLDWEPVNPSTSRPVRTAAGRRQPSR